MIILLILGVGDEQAKLELMLKSMQEGVVSFDLEGEILVTNASIYRLFECDDQVALYQLFEDESIQKVIQLAKSGKTDSIEFRFKTEGIPTNTGSYNTAMGDEALASNTTASGNTAVGYQAGYSCTTGANNTLFCNQAGYYYVVGTIITYVGNGAGIYCTGSKNTIVGGYNGNQGGLDIRTASNYIVLSDGDGNPRQIFDANGNAYFASTASVGGASARITISTPNLTGSYGGIGIKNEANANKSVQANLMYIIYDEGKKKDNYEGIFHRFTFYDVCMYIGKKGR